MPKGISCTNFWLSGDLYLQTGTWGWIAASWPGTSSDWMYQNCLPCTNSDWFDEIHLLTHSQWYFKRTSTWILSLFCSPSRSCVREGKLSLSFTSTVWNLSQGSLSTQSYALHTIPFVCFCRYLRMKRFTICWLSGSTHYM